MHTHTSSCIPLQQHCHWFLPHGTLHWTYIYNTFCGGDQNLYSFKLEYMNTCPTADVDVRWCVCVNIQYTHIYTYIMYISSSSLDVEWFMRLIPFTHIPLHNFPHEKREMNISIGVLSLDFFLLSLYLLLSMQEVATGRAALLYSFHFPYLHLLAFTYIHYGRASSSSC